MHTTYLQTEITEAEILNLLRTSARRLFRKGNYQEALGPWLSTFYMSKELLGDLDQSTAVSAEYVARTLDKLGRSRDATAWWKVAYFVNRQNMGPDHESSVMIAFRAAESFAAAQKPRQSIPFWSAAFHGCCRLYGKYNFSTVACLDGYLRALHHSCRFQEVIELGVEALLDYERDGVGQGRNWNWLGIARTVAECHMRPGHFQEALKYWAIHLRMLTALNLSKPGRVLFSLERNAFALENCGRLQEALAEIERCIDISSQLHGSESASTANHKRRHARVSELARLSLG